MRNATVLGLLACVLAAVSMVTIQAKDASPPTVLGRALHLDALGAPKPDAPLARRQPGDVRVRIDRAGFEVSGPEASVSLQGLDTGSAGWSRFARGASRRTPFGSETIVVTPHETEQFLTVDRHQGERTWRWRLASPGISPRVGADGAVSFVQGHTLAAVGIAPVQILDAEGADVTPASLRWSVRRAGKAWSLELRLDDSDLPTPYVIDPAITYRTPNGTSTATGSSNSVSVAKPTGAQPNDLLVATIALQTGSTTVINTVPTGWTIARARTDNGTSVSVVTYYHVVAASGDAGPYAWGLSASKKWVGSISAYVGVNSSASPIVQSTANTGSSSTPTALGVNGTAGNWGVVALGFNGSSTFVPSGYTERFDATPGGAGAISGEGGDFAMAGGATGNKTAAAGSSKAWAAQLLELKLDTVAPSLPAPSLSESSADTFVSGSTLYYRPASTSFSFTVTGAPTDPQSGVQKVNLPGLTGGFTPATALDVVYPGPYVRTYTWATGVTDSGAKTVTAYDNASNTATSSFTLTPDSTAPSTSILCNAAACSAGWYGTSPVSITLSSSDGGSAVSQIKYTTDGSDPTLANGTVYSGAFNVAGTTTIKYAAWDNVSNAETVHTQLVQIDTTAPSAPTLAYGSFSNAALTSGVVYYRPGAASGQFAVTASSTDNESGVFGYTFPAAATGWSRLLAGDTVTYSHTGSPTDPAEPNNVTATNNASLTSGASSFTVTPDSTAPSSAILCNGAACSAGWYTSSPVSITLSSSDGASGVNQIKYTTDGTDPTSSGTAVTYSGAFNLSATSTTVRFAGYDNVGNVETPQSQLVRIDTTAPSNPTFTYGSLSNVVVTGGVVYYLPSAASGQFAVTASSTDNESGVSGYTFPAAAAGWSRSIAGATATYSHTGSPTDPAEPNNVTATNNASLTSGASSFTVTPDSTAPSSSILCDGGSCAPWFTTSPVSVTLSATDGGSGLSLIKYTTDGTDPTSSGTAVTYSGAFNLSATSTTVRFAGYDNVGNVEAPQSQLVRVDATAPSAPTFTYDSFSNAAVTGGVVYYQPGAASGQFAVTASSTDNESGVSGYTFPAAATGWSRSIVGSTATYSHTGSPTDPAEPNNVTAQNNAGLSSNASSFTVTPDSSLPASAILCNGGACSAGWHTSSPVSVTLSANDTGSGVSQIKYTTDGTDPTLGNGTVYAGAFNVAATTTVKYRAWDNVGNAEAVQTKLIQIDATAPTTPTFSFSSLTNAVTTGQTVYFRPGVAGGVTITASSTDGESGVASYAFPALGFGWSGSQAGASFSYSFTNAAVDPVEPLNSTATNNAGLTSSPGSFTVTADGTAPVSSIICILGNGDNGPCSGGWYTSAISVSLSAGDGGSGLQEIRFTTDGTDPSPINGTVYSAPVDILVTTTVKFRAYDRLGNEEAVGSQLVQVDPSAPTVPALTVSETPASPNQHVSGATLYYNPQGGNAGSFTVDAVTSDLESGVEKVTFPAVTGMTGGGDDPTNPYQGSYSWTAGATGSGAQTVTARNNAALTSTANFTVTPDTTAPGSQTAALVGGPYYTSTSVAFTTGDGSDAGAGLNTSSRLVERASATLSDGACTGGFTSFGGSYASPDTSVVSGNCYRYRFTIADNVGNVSTALVTVDAKVDTSAPTATMGDPGANLRGTVVLTSTSGDPESGVATVTYQRSPAGQNTWTATAASWDTTGVADGLYDLRVVVTSNAGTTTNSALVASRRVDNTAPSASMDNPGSPLSDIVPLTSTASDVSGSGLDTAIFEYSYQGTGPWTTIATDSSAPFGVDWDTNDGLDGRYNLRVIVTDVAGNSTTSSTVTNRKVQNLPPLIDITSPGNYINAASPSPFTITTTTEALQFGVDHVEFFRCTDASVNCSTGTFASIGVDFTDPYTASWAQASEPEGNRTLNALLVDGDGGTGEDVFNVVIDRTAPTGSITAPGPGAYVGGPTVAVSSDSADTLSGVTQVVFQRSPAGQAVWTTLATDTTSPYSLDWNTTSLSDGAFDLRAVTTDMAGNSFDGPVTTVNVDNTGPTATQDDPGTNLRAAVTLTGSASDPAGIAQVAFQRSPTGQSSWTTIDTDMASPYSVSFDTTAVVDGLYDFRVVATDSVGNASNSAAISNRSIDNTNPTATQDDPGVNLRAGVTLTASAGDTGGTGVAQVVFQRSPAGAGTWIAIDTDLSAPYSVGFDTTAVSDGLYDLRAVATDVAGNSANSTVIGNRRVDNTPPSATMNDPGANLNGTVGLTSTTSDGGSGLATVTYEYSLAGQSSWTTTPASWDTTILGDGLYDLRVIATDVAGNSTTSAPIVNRRVDNGVPSISISSPTTYVNGGDADPFTVTAITLDTDLVGVQFFTCDNASASCSTGSWISLGTDAGAPYSASWALPGADGNRALRAVATDLSSNTDQDVHNVTIDRTTPTGGSVSYLDGYDTTGSLTITTADGTDTGTGLDTGSGLIQRDVALLTGGTCGSFADSWSTVSSPDSVASGSCYRYRYRIADLAGNLATYTSGSVAKVDTSAPSAPSSSFSALTNAVASGQTVYFRSGAAGGFTVTAASSDAQSGIDSYDFPALGTGWSGTAAGDSTDYSFGSSAADPVEPLNVTAQNNAGLDSSPGSFTVSADGAAPVSSISCDGAACTAGWYMSTVSVALSASDAAGAGLQEIRYTTDGSDPSPINGTIYAGAFDVSATTTVKFRAYDLLGNEEAVASRLVQIDGSAPAAPALSFGSFQNAVLAGGVVWYRPSAAGGRFAVTASSSDVESGIAGYTFPAAAAGWSRSIGGATATYDHSGSPADPAEPNDVTAQNNAGLSSAPTSFTADPDGSAPASSIACDGAACSGGWYTSTVSVTLSASDAASGLQEIRYTTDGSDPTPGNGTVYSGAFDVSAMTTVRFRAYDLVGNEETVGSQLVRIDTSAPAAPTLTLSESPGSPKQHVSGTTLFYNPQGSNAGSFTVDAAASDSGSGIDRVSFAALTGMTGGGDDATSPYEASYDWNSGSSASGAQTVTVHNNAGLTSSTTFTVTPDSAPPTGQSAAVTGGFYTSLSVPVTLQNGSDALSGIDPATAVLERETATLANGSCDAWSGSWNAVSLTGGADTTVQSNRCYHYRYSISDNVGNESTSATSADAMVDATTPVTSDDAPAGWGNAAVTVTLSVTETGSGVASTVHRVDGGSFQGGTSISIPAPADHSNDGPHTIEYRSTDVAGNVETLRSATVRIDTTLPTTTDDAPTGWSDSPVTVTLIPADALSGIASTQYRIDGGSFLGGTSISIPAPADRSNDGAHTIEYRSTDNAGNAEPLQAATVRIDTQLPSGALTAPVDGAHVNGSVAISASAADLTSGVASVEFLVRPNGSGSFTTISTDTTAPYEADWDSTAAAEGDAELEVVVVDSAGLSITSVIRTVIVDNPPTPSLDDPGAELAGPVTLTAASQADTTQIVFERSPAGAGTWTQIATDASAPFSADFDTTSVGDGQYDFRAVATDLGGFDGTSALRTARVDNTMPTVSVSDPASGAVVSGASVHIAALASDLGSGVSSVRFEQRPAGGGAFTPIGTDTTDPYEASWDATGLGGSYELRAVATDAAGNPATAATVTVTVDAAAPTVTLADPGTLLHGVVNLSASAPSAAVASVSFDRRPAGGTWTRILLDTARPWSAALDTKSVADGVYDLRAQALGSGGQVLATHSHAGITIDNTAPTMRSSVPADGSVVTPVTSIALVASEPVSTVQGAFLDGSAAAAVISGADVTFSTSRLGAGTHALTGALVDAAGNSGAFAVHFTVEVEAQAPFTLRVSKPTSRTRARGTECVFGATVFLSGSARVEATLLSPTGRRLSTQRMRLTAGRHPLRFTLPTASIPPGRYTILVIARGPDGSKRVKRVYVKVAVEHTTTPEPAEGETGQREVVFPVAPASNSGGGAVSEAPDSPTPPPARPSKPEPTKQAPHAKSGTLETASGYVGNSRPGRHTAALVIGLLLLGGALAFLIKIEMGRMLRPRR